MATVSASKKKINKADKYTQLVEGFENTKTINETILSLKKTRDSLFYKPIDELKLIKTNVDAILEDYKRDSIMSNITPLITALITFVIGTYKEFTPVVVGFILTNERDINLISILINLIVLIFFAVSLYRFLSALQLATKEYLKIIQLVKILELIISDRQIWESLHGEAYNEYRKFQKEKLKQFTI